MAQTHETKKSAKPVIGATARSEHRLKMVEFFWRDHYLWLEEKGYRLRPRYHPEWVASWKGTDNSGYFCEDAQTMMGTTTLLDATRISDGAYVMLKKISTSDGHEEIKIHRLLTEASDASHGHNRCIPLYDVLDVPDDAMSLIVIPLLAYWFSPPMRTIGEMVEFIRQTFDGVQFMHSLNIAHNDIKWSNIMMDSSPLHDEPVHPAHQIMKRDYSGYARKPRCRTLRPVRYYHIDFGYSRQYDRGTEPPREFVGAHGYGGDCTVPEFKTQEYCDPFPVDVYRIGNVVRRFTIEMDPIIKRKRRGFGFLKPLVDDMCQEDPTKRPTIDEVVKRFADIVAGLSSWKLGSRVAYKDELPFLSIYRYPAHWVRQIVRMVRHIPPVPTT